MTTPYVHNPLHGQNAQRVPLDTDRFPHLEKVDRLNLMIDLLNEVTDGVWRPAVNATIDWITEVDGKEITFDLRDWQVEEHKDGEHCGYSACAVGHACLDSRFKWLGLTFVFGTPTYMGMASWSAVGGFFGVSPECASFLFSNDDYQQPFSFKEPNKRYPDIHPTPSLVAQRIELFLRRVKDDLNNA